MRSDVSFRIFPFERFPSFEKASASVSKSVSVLWSISLINVTSKRSRRGQSETRTRKCDSAVRSSVEVAASHPDRILFVVVFHGPAPIQGYRRSFRPYISFPYLSLSLSLSLSFIPVRLDRVSSTNSSTLQHTLGTNIGPCPFRAADYFECR